MPARHSPVPPVREEQLPVAGSAVLRPADFFCFQACSLQRHAVRSCQVEQPAAGCSRIGPGDTGRKTRLLKGRHQLRADLIAVPADSGADRNLQACRVRVAVPNESADDSSGQPGYRAPPAAMRGSDNSCSRVEEQQCRAIRPGDRQQIAGGVSPLRVRFAGGTTGLRTDYEVTVHLSEQTQIRRSRAEAGEDANAVALHAGRVIGSREAQVQCRVRPGAHAAAASHETVRNRQVSGREDLHQA